MYALRGRGSEGLFEPHGTMDEMADIYLEAIRGAHPGGPYHLVGWSAGGVFAYELARRLREGGEPLGIVALIDTPLPSIYDQVDLNDHAHFLADFLMFVERFSQIDMGITYDRLRSLSYDEQLDLTLREAKAKGVVPRSVSEEYLRRLVETSRTHVKTIKQYEIQALEHPIHLFLPEQSGTLEELSRQDLPEDLGWRRVLGQHLVLHHSPGEHFDMMTGVHAAKLAEQLRELLEATK
jgi:myxalamid-type polyketide synthase MxaB